MSTHLPLRPLDDMAIRINKDGSISVGVLPEIPEAEDKAEKPASASEEKKPVKKTTRKTVKK